MDEEQLQRLQVLEEILACEGDRPILLSLTEVLGIITSIQNTLRILSKYEHAEPMLIALARDLQNKVFDKERMPATYAYIEQGWANAIDGLINLDV